MPEVRSIFIGDPADRYRQRKDVSGASYTFKADDADSLIVHTHGSAATPTVPPDVDVTFPVGTVITVLQGGAGQLTITPGAGVTLRRAQPTFKALAQYAKVEIEKLAANEWKVSGELAAS